MAFLTFDELGIRLQVRGPKSVLEASLEELVEIRHLCGGLGMCTTCRIRVVEGASTLGAPSAAELHRLGRHRLEQGWRLACQTVLRDADVTVRLPRYA
ncbi:MAG: 2Fe-2S iron-sulfur cluster-binding protein [Gemmatimonadota bacterium]